MAHATKLVPFRVIFVYMLSVTFITLLVPSDDERLLGGGGVAASPFVIAVKDANIPGIPHILNAGMIIGILGIAAESVYISSRIIRTMAHQKLIPEIVARVDNKGRPRWALAITILVATFLTYIQLSCESPYTNPWVCALTNHSGWCNCIELARQYHKLLLLLQLDHHLLHVIQIPPSAEGTERPSAQGDLRLGIDDVASRSCLVNDHLDAHLCWMPRCRHQPSWRSRLQCREFLRVYARHPHHRVVHGSIQAHLQDPVA